MSALRSTFTVDELRGHAIDVAPRLLNVLLVVGDRSVRIVEVEAYGAGDDPASHAHRGPRPRTVTMFGPPGHLYTYISYGLHVCCNVVTSPEGQGGAVLLRAGAPVDGIDRMRSDRPRARRDVDLTNGPGKLTEALRITMDHGGTDVTDPSSPVVLAHDGVAPPQHPEISTRIGISVAVDASVALLGPRRSVRVAGPSVGRRLRSWIQWARASEHGFSGHGADPRRRPPSRPVT